MNRINIIYYLTMSDPEKMDSRNSLNNSEPGPSSPVREDSGTKRSRSPESIDSETSKRSRKEKRSRRMDPEDIKLIAKEMFSMLNVASSSSSSQNSSGGRVEPDTVGQDSSDAVQDSDSPGSVIALQGSENDDLVSLHAPSKLTDSGDSKLSGKSAASRVTEDFPEEDEAFTKVSERAFKKTLLLLSEVLGDKLPSRPLSRAGLRGMSDRGDSLGQDADKRCFPHSSLIQSSFDHIKEAMTGSIDADLSDPTNLPDKLDSRILSESGTKKLKVPSYHDKYYSLHSDVFSSLAPEVDHSLENHVFGKRSGSWKSQKCISAKDVTSIERSSRKTLCVISSMDVLLDAIQSILEKDKVESPELSLLFSSLSRSIAHAAAHSAQGVAQSMVARRKCFLSAAGKEVPEPIHEWLLCQPLLSNSDKPSSLFGNVTGKIRDFKQKQDKAAANVSLASLKHPGHSSSKSKSSKPKSSGAHTHSRDAYSGRADNRRPQFKGNSAASQFKKPFPGSFGSKKGGR